jgi:hypothetical protein
MTRDWHSWHREYDDPASSLSRRLEEVRVRLAALLEVGTGPVRLLSLCAGDGRDTIPVLAGSERHVRATLVELDPELGEAAEAAARAAGVDIDVRTDDAGLVAAWSDVLPVDVLMLCGVFGNVADGDVALTVTAARSMLSPGGAVIWTRGHRVPHDQDPLPSGAVPSDGSDQSERVRGLFTASGFEEVAFVKPADATYRVGVVRLATPSTAPLPDRLFSFAR